jgi:hypothetical protein
MAYLDKDNLHINDTYLDKDNLHINDTYLDTYSPISDDVYNRDDPESPPYEECCLLGCYAMWLL